MTLPDGWLRQLLPLVALVVLAGGSWAAAEVADPDDAGAEPAPYAVAPVDPVLSPRRLPRALQTPLAEAALEPPIQALLDAAPPDTCLVVERGDRELVSHNPDAPLVPASNQKLLTTWTALQVLGPDATFRTTVVTTAPVVGGVLEGDLWLVGGGDPVLATDAWMAQFEQGPQMVRTRFEDLADAVVAAGITRIAGTVVGDESRYDTARTVPSWAQRLVEQDQAGPLSALLVNEGIEQFPPRFVNRSSYVPSAEPAVHAAAQLVELLAQRGITTGAPPRAGVAPAGATEVAAIESPPVQALVRAVNAWSNNTAAELLLKAVDHHRGGRGTTAGGTAAVVEELAAADLPVDGIVVADGSGLAESDRVTCRLLHELLDRAGPDSVLAASLPLAGVDGTLRGRFVGTPADGRIRAKTGSLRGVSSLSGFAESASEPDGLLSFAFIANAPGPDGVLGAPVIQHQDPFVAGLASFPQAPPLDQLDPRDPQPVS